MDSEGCEGATASAVVAPSSGNCPPTPPRAARQRCLPQRQGVHDSNRTYVDRFSNRRNQKKTSPHPKPGGNTVHAPRSSENKIAPPYQDDHQGYSGVSNIEGSGSLPASAGLSEQSYPPRQDGYCKPSAGAAPPSYYGINNTTNSNRSQGYGFDPLAASGAPADSYYCKGMVTPASMSIHNDTNLRHHDTNAPHMDPHDVTTTQQFLQEPLSPTPHTNGPEGCRCPVCLMSYHIAFLFSAQRRASPSVMASYPSDWLKQTGGVLPELPPIPSLGLCLCPIMYAYGFCPYGSGCYLTHECEHATPFVAPTGTPDGELHRLQDMARRRLDEEMWNCDVCGYKGIDEFCLSPVGETFLYRMCPNCSLHCYFPYITYLVEAVLSQIGDDYQKFKDKIDEYRNWLPDEFKVPLMFEAHRIASVVFAWSLVSPRDVRDALEAALSVEPALRRVCSIGSGAGYVEHIFNRVANPGVGTECGTGAFSRQYSPSIYSPTSFDGVTCSISGKRMLEVIAFDNLSVLKDYYSVNVCVGDPLSVVSQSNCSDTVLLLCWPPFGSPQEEQSSMGYETLEHFRFCGGRLVIYIGDVASTGDWRFHRQLYMYYKLVRDYPVRRELRRWLPQEMGLVYAGNDTIGVYELRQTPLPSTLCDFGR